MNIALFTDTYPPFINGVSTSCFNLTQTLKAHGHNVLVVTPRSSKGPFEIKDGVIYVPGFELKKLYGYRLTSIFSTKLLRIVRDFKPDLIHNQTDSTIGQCSKIIAHRLKIPIVYTYHTAYEEYTYYFTHGFLDRIAKKTIRSYTKLVANNTTEFITPSVKTKEYMRGAGSDIYINVIPTGIDFSIFADDKVDKERQRKFKEEHHIDEDTKTFLILGRIAKEKSMDVSIRGFAKYHEMHPEQKIKLIVVGNGPQKPELEELVKTLGIDDIVVFIGAVPASEVPFYYHLADIYTSASVTETQGLTFMEAMAAGAIVLARYDTNLSGTIIDNDTGFFFTSDEEFVKKVDRIFSMKEEERQKIRQNAYEIVDIYSIERFYQKIMEVYNRAIKKYW